MLSIQFRLTQDIKKTAPIARIKELSTNITQLKTERDSLQERVDKLRDQLDQAASGPQLADLKSKLELARVEAGVTNVSGPGIEVTLNDSNIAFQVGENPSLYVLHDEDVLRIINELKAAEAEALSINGQRLLATSEIRCIGPTILVNKNKRLVPPYVITAIGDPDKMIGALKMRGGVIEQLQVFGIQVNVKKLSSVTVPAYNGSTTFDYATPVQD